MGLLSWIEQTGLAEWVRLSAAGYPLMIASHAIGMAVVVGLVVAIDLRMLGAFGGIPYRALHRFFSIAWLGFGLNFLSGAALFSAQATSYVTNTVFWTKMALIFVGAITVAYMQNLIGRDTKIWNGAPAGVRAVALASIVFWVGAIITGRLIAYL